MYIDRDITISETDSAIARITDEDGNVFKADDIVDTDLIMIRIQEICI